MLPWQQLRARCCPGFLLLNTDHQSKENPWALCNLAQYKTPRISFLNKNSAKQSAKDIKLCSQVSTGDSQHELSALSMT